MRFRRENDLSIDKPENLLLISLKNPFFEHKRKTQAGNFSIKGDFRWVFKFSLKESFEVLRSENGIIRAFGFIDEKDQKSRESSAENAAETFGNSVKAEHVDEASESSRTFDEGKTVENSKLQKHFGVRNLLQIL